LPSQCRAEIHDAGTRNDRALGHQPDVASGEPVAG
jgi:hypothetical protein